MMLSLIEFIAVVASCLFGILQARRFGMDFLGIFTVAFATSFGGGTLRDVLLSRQPLFWIENEHYLLVVFGITLTTCFIPKIPGQIRKLLVVPDALGLALFSVVGTEYAILAGTGWFTAVMFGVITGAFGGVISDVLCNQVPTLFRSAPLFATVSFVGGWVYLLVKQLPVQPFVPTLVAFLFIFVFRLAAVYFDIHLPTHHDETEEPKKA